MIVFPAPLFAAGDLEMTLLAFYGPFWLTVVVITTTVLVLSHRRKVRQCELGAEIIRDMLGRKMTAAEIQRVLVAWTGRSRALKKLVQEQARASAAGSAVDKPVLRAG